MLYIDFIATQTQFEQYLSLLTERFLTVHYSTKKAIILTHKIDFSGTKQIHLKYKGERFSVLFLLKD